MSIIWLVHLDSDRKFNFKASFNWIFFYLRTPSDVKSDLKFRILGPKSPKIGHCEKMSQLIKMTQNDFFFNWADNITLQTVSRVTQIIPRHLQDTLQTPSGHPKIWPILYNLRQLAEKESAGENEWNRCLHIVPPLTVSRVTQTDPRCLPNTFETPYRHPKILHILTNLSNSGKGNKLIKNVPNLIVINCLHIIHPRKYLESLRPPDTSQTPKRNPKMGHSMANQGPMREPATKNNARRLNNWFVMVILQVVSRVTKTPPRHRWNTFEAPSRHP